MGLWTVVLQQHESGFCWWKIENLLGSCCWVPESLCLLSKLWMMQIAFSFPSLLTFGKIYFLLQLCPHILHYGRVDPASKSLKFPVSRPCEAGDQCYLSYGSFPASHLIMFYGFLPKGDNPYDVIPLGNIFTIFPSVSLFGVRIILS